MAESIYDQSADIIATQVKTLADAISTTLIPESALTVRAFDWKDIDGFPGLSLRTLEGAARFANITDDTNSASNVGYQFVLVMRWPKDYARDQRTRHMRQLLESVRQYYHHKRRLGAVVATDVRENSCTVQNGGPSPPASIRMENRIEMLTIIGWFLEPR